MTSTFLGLMLVVIYVSIMIIKEKTVPPSISETFYYPFSGGHWFTVTLFAASVLIMAGLLSMTDGTAFQFVSFLSSGGIAFVGAAPHFHDSEKTVHYIGALFLLVGSQIWLGLYSSPWVFTAWLSALKWQKSTNWLFYLEMTAVVTMMIGIFLI